MIYASLLLFVTLWEVIKRKIYCFLFFRVELDGSICQWPLLGKSEAARWKVVGCWVCVGPVFYYKTDYPFITSCRQGQLRRSSWPNDLRSLRELKLDPSDFLVCTLGVGKSLSGRCYNLWSPEKETSKLPLPFPSTE